MELSESHDQLVDPTAPVVGDTDPAAAKPLQGTEAHFDWRWFALLFASVFLLLLFREPNIIRKPSFMAEDGFVYFKEAYEEPFTRIVLRPHSGYIQLIPRLTAGLAGLVPLEYMPLAYGLAALFLTTASLTFLATPCFRSLIRSDGLRAVVALTLPLMPNADALGRVSYLHWYGLFFLVLLTFMQIPVRRSVAGLLWVAAAGVFWSHPVAIFCVPILAYRAWRAASGGERAWWIALLLVALPYPLTTDGQSALHTLWQAPGILLSVLHAIGYRVFCFFVVGQDVSRLILLGAGWDLVVRLSFFCLGLCVAAWWPRSGRSPQTPFVLALLFYYVLVVPVPFVLRPEIPPDFLETNERTWLGHQRYFYVSVMLLCVFAAVAYQRIGLSWKHHAAASVLLVCWLGLHATTYRMWDFQSHPSWPHFARHIRQVEARVKQTGVGERVAIQTNPFAFALDVGSPTPDVQAQW